MEILEKIELLKLAHQIAKDQVEINYKKDEDCLSNLNLLNSSLETYDKLLHKI